MAQFQSSAGVSGRSGVITLESTLVTNTPMSSTIFFGGQVLGVRRERVRGVGANGAEP
jgi:hypothetical protein